MSWLVRVGRTHWQGHQDPSKSVPIFERGTEADLEMVPIYRVPMPRNRTVFKEPNSTGSRPRDLIGLSAASETVTPLTSWYPTPDDPMPDVYWGRGGSELT